MRRDEPAQAPSDPGPGARLLRFIPVLLVWLIWAMPALGAPANVLLVFSNNRLLPANIELDQGLREVLGAADGRSVDLFAEFLDMPYFSGEPYESRMATHLREKYAARPPRVVIAIGSSALEFMLKHRETMFPGTPVLHAAVDAAFLEARTLPLDVLGAPVDYDLAGTVALALRLHPGARRIVVVTGTSRFDREREAGLRRAIASAQPAVPVEYLAGLPHREVLQRLAQLGRDDVVITAGYFADGADARFAPRQSVVEMLAVAGGPLYVPYATFLGTGVVGGRVVPFADMGRETGLLVNRLVAGVAPSDIRVPELVARPLLDWRQIRRWGIEERDVPADAMILYREPTMWESYRTPVIVALMVILLQAGMIAALLFQKRRHRRTMAALAESEQRTSLAARAARLSMWIWDLRGQRTWSDARMREGAGLSRAVPVDFQQVLATIHPADRGRFEAAVRDAAAQGAELDIEYRVGQPEGDTRWFAARGHAAPGDPDCLAGVKMDITARKVAEAQAAADRAALTHMARVSTMGQMSAAIAHQLNQPLAAILGNAEAAGKMLRRQPIDLEEVRMILDDIVAEDHRAAEVIRRLGALYKRGEVEMARVDLNELISETLELVRAEFMMRQVGVAVDLASSLPDVHGGRVQLQQVLLNLLLNAADAMSGVPAEQRLVEIRTVRDGDGVEVCVRDHGTGIAPQDLRRVFDPFWSTKATGVGVGLAICHAIVTAHRGTLAAANDPGGGAVFRMRLPAAPAAAENG